MKRHVNNPQVTVIVNVYNSRKISVLDEVRAPGLLRLSGDIDLLEALSRAGGMSEDADLQGALVLRDRQMVSADFARLLKQGDAGRNIGLLPGRRDPGAQRQGQVRSSSSVRWRGRSSSP